MLPVMVLLCEAMECGFQWDCSPKEYERRRARRRTVPVLLPFGQYLAGVKPKGPVHRREEGMKGGGGEGKGS
jgi:hypothetical protein